MTDIEGVTGVTTFRQAENTEFGRDMLMNDLKAVLAGIKDAGGEAIVYDMHTDGRNVRLEEIDAPVVMGKPILPYLWRGIGGEGIDGLFMVGLHTMQHEKPIALLQHSYLREYDAIYINGILLGEIGVEAALAAEAGVPLKFVSGDDLGCREAEALGTGVVTCPVKTSLGADTALCLAPSESTVRLREAAKKAALTTVAPFTVKAPYEIRIQFSDCPYLSKMRELHPEIFADERTAVIKGENLLETWSRYLLMEKEMVRACQ